MTLDALHTILGSKCVLNAHQRKEKGSQNRTQKLRNMYRCNHESCDSKIQSYIAFIRDTFDSVLNGKFRWSSLTKPHKSVNVLDGQLQGYSIKRCVWNWELLRSAALPIRSPTGSGITHCFPMSTVRPVRDRTAGTSQLDLVHLSKEKSKPMPRANISELLLGRGFGKTFFFSSGLPARSILAFPIGIRKSLFMISSDTSKGCP